MGRFGRLLFRDIHTNSSLYGQARGQVCRMWRSHEFSVQAHARMERVRPSLRPVLFSKADGALYLPGQARHHQKVGKPKYFGKPFCLICLQHTYW